MDSVAMLPDFLIKEVEIEKNKYEYQKIFECDKENGKFLNLYEKGMEKLIYKAMEYFEISKGYDYFFNELKSRFLFSIKKNGTNNSENVCFDYLMDFLDLRDNLNLIEDFEDKIHGRLEDLDFFMFKVNEYTLVFYFGSTEIESSLYYRKRQEEKKIKVFHRIKYRSNIEYQKINAFNRLFDKESSHSDYKETMDLYFEELVGKL